MVALMLISIGAFAAFGVSATPAARRVLACLREMPFRCLNYAAIGIAGIAIAIAAGSQLQIRQGVRVATDLEENGLKASVLWLTTELSGE